jgi:cytochrome c oxidase assembly protein subunit 11
VKLWGVFNLKAPLFFLRKIDYVPNMNQPNQHELKQRNRRMVMMVFAVVFLMLSLAYASVPLYRLFCQVTGFGGTTQVAGENQPAPTILDRKITIQLNTDVAPQLNWRFWPEKKQVTLNVGQEILVNFIAENQSDITLAGTALYNVTPAKAGIYFQKIQCFCFDKQILQPHQKANLPVLFYVDPEMDKDPDMKDVTNITLSYHFFRSETEELEQAKKAFYNQ